MFDRRKTVIGIERAERKIGSLFKRPSVFRRKSTTGNGASGNYAGVGDRVGSRSPAGPSTPFESRGGYSHHRDGTDSENNPYAAGRVSYEVDDEDDFDSSGAASKKVRFYSKPGRKRTLHNRSKTPVEHAHDALVYDRPYLDSPSFEEVVLHGRRPETPTHPHHHNNNQDKSDGDEKHNLFELTTTSTAGSDLFSNDDPFDESTAAVPRFEAPVMGPKLSDYRRKRRSEVFDARTAQELEAMRSKLRMEQPPPPESMDGIRASMDVQGLTTAEGLLSMIPK